MHMYVRKNKRHMNALDFWNDTCAYPFSTLSLTALCPKIVICKDWSPKDIGTSKCSGKIKRKKVSATRFLFP